MRSTPTPAEIFRTVKVALMPAPRRAIHTPSNACSRSLSPSRTRTMTRTVSPGSNAGRSVRNPSRSTALNRSIACSLSPSVRPWVASCALFFQPLRPQIGPPLARDALDFRRAPLRNLVVIAAQQYRRDIQSAIAERPGVARRRQHSVVVRVRRGRLVVAQGPREQPHHGVDDAQRRRLSARERSEEHTSELQSLAYLVCRLLLEKKKNNKMSREDCIT